VLILISYDLMTAERPTEIDAVETAIRESNAPAIRVMHSVWLVQSNEDVGTWGPRLSSLLSKQDRLVVARLQSAANVNGWLPPAQWEWVKEHDS
jgi:hypothetical protein